MDLEVISISRLRGERADPRTAWDFRIAARGFDQQVCMLWRGGSWIVCDGLGTALADAQIAARLGIDAQSAEARLECARVAEREYLRANQPALRAVA